MVPESARMSEAQYCIPFIIVGMALGAAAGYVAGIAVEGWSGPPYIYYVIVVSVPPALALVAALSRPVADRLPSARSVMVLRSSAIAFAVMYAAGWYLYFFLKA